MNIYEKLSIIQASLVAQKDMTNKFGGYKYRSCESILKALKPLLVQHNCSVRLNDQIMEVAGRVYVQATATIIDNEGNTIESVAYAREAAAKKGMDEAQVTGSTSSYARKYALSGLFAVDDTADADALNTNPEFSQPYDPYANNNQNNGWNNNQNNSQGNVQQPHQAQQPQVPAKAEYLNEQRFTAAINRIKAGRGKVDVLLDKNLYTLTPDQYAEASALKQSMEA